MRNSLLSQLGLESEELPDDEKTPLSDPEPVANPNEAEGEETEASEVDSDGSKADEVDEPAVDPTVPLEPVGDDVDETMVSAHKLGASLAASDSLIESMHALEALQRTLEPSVASGGLTTTEAQLTHQLITTIVKPYGIETRQFIPSLEAFATNQRVIATEAALESVKEAFVKFWQALKKHFLAFWDRLVDFFKQVFSSAKKVKTRADELRTKAASHRKASDTETFEFRNVQHLSVKGMLPDTNAMTSILGFTMVVSQKVLNNPEFISAEEIASVPGRRETFTKMLDIPDRIMEAIPGLEIQTVVRGQQQFGLIKKLNLKVAASHPLPGDVCLTTMTGRTSLSLGSINMVIATEQLQDCAALLNMTRLEYISPDKYTTAGVPERREAPTAVPVLPGIEIEHLCKAISMNMDELIKYTTTLNKHSELKKRFIAESERIGNEAMKDASGVVDKTEAWTEKRLMINASRAMFGLVARVASAHITYVVGLGRHLLDYCEESLAHSETGLTTVHVDPTTHPQLSHVPA